VDQIQGLVAGGLAGELFLQQAAGNECSNSAEQPFDAPQLNGLPIENGSRAKEDAHTERSHDTEHAEKERNDGRRCEAKAFSQRNQFGEAGNFQGVGSVQIGTAGATGVTVNSANEELGAAAAG
jgi:hypothetical protein